MLDRTDAQEKNRLGNGVEDDEEHGRPDRLGGAHARTSRDEAEVRDRGIGKHALGVALTNGEEAAEHKRHAAHHDDHDGCRRVDHVERGEFHEQEHAGLDHSRGMQQRTRGCRRDHGAEQPLVKRHLSRLGEAGDGKHEQRHDEQRRLRPCCDIGEAVDRKRHARDVQHHQRHVKRQAAHHVEVDLKRRAALRVRRAREADHEVRAHGGNLPARNEPVEVVRGHDDEHRRKKEEHEGDELVTAIGRLLSALFCRLALMMLEVLHVAESVDADCAAHEAHDEHHDDREGVDIHGRRTRVFRMQGERPAPDRHRKLDGREREHGAVAAANRLHEHEAAEEEVDRNGNVIPRKRKLRRECEARRLAQICHRRRDAHHGDNRGTPPR